MNRISHSMLMAVLLACTSLNNEVSAFSVQRQSTTRHPTKMTRTTSTTLSMEAMNRRDLVSFGMATAALSLAAPQPAAAKYSDYARREKDWVERNEKGQIQVRTARDLRSELREIVPQNTSASTIFCPNGPSASVSPLMENKCGDRLATPSVYGRSNDSTGNSVPGFKAGYAFAAGQSSAISDAGGFPKYRENEWTIREYGK